jgi:hypothetical protein
MADYKLALEEGFSAAKKAEIARNEVEQVLTKLKDDLLAASDGKLLVEIRQFEEIRGTPQYYPGATLSAMLAKSSRPKLYYSALAATNPKSTKPVVKELARWKQDEDGYPCALIWGKTERQFEDREALEEGLAELLKDPGVGEKLFVLTKLN